MAVTMKMHMDKEVYGDEKSRAYMQAQRAWAQTLNNSVPFEVGKTYLRYDGRVVTCIAVNNEMKGYETAQFDDYTIHEGRKLGWRYNRASDRGRVTASAFFNPKNVHPEIHTPALGIQAQIHKSDFLEGLSLIEQIQRYAVLPVSLAQQMDRYVKRVKQEKQVFHISLHSDVWEKFKEENVDYKSFLEIPAEEIPQE